MNIFFNTLFPSNLTGSNFPFFHDSTTNNCIIYSQSDPGCTRCAGASYYYPTYLRGGDCVLEQVADGSINLPDDDPEMRLGVMQQQLYEQVQASPVLATVNSAIQDFMDSNQTNTFGYIHNISKCLKTGNLVQAQSLLSNWVGDGELDNNYRSYYGWLLRMMSNRGWKPDSADVYQLASKCPVKAGTVVYAARNLYNFITGENERFKNACNDGSSLRPRNQKGL